MFSPLKRRCLPVMIAAALLPIAAYAQSWQPLTTAPNFNAGVSLLLTDGTVMVYHLDSLGYGTGLWSKLTPDENGSYVNGTWTTLAPMPSGYAPLYFASAVLADGKIIVEGGEYNEQYRRCFERRAADRHLHAGRFAHEPGGISR